MKKFFHILPMVLMLLTVTTAKAQDDVEYRMELGGGVNLTAYQGDMSGSLFGNAQAGGSVLFRAILNPRSAVRFGLGISKLKGDVSRADTHFPDISDLHYSFSNTMADFSVTYEYNFFPYGTGRDYRGAKRFTPFISLGLGMTYVNSKNGTYDYSKGHEAGDDFVPEHHTKKGVVTGNVPIGVGMKYKLGDRTNISLDWHLHVSFSDNLDGVDDPYRIESTGLFKNTDCYSTITLALTYSLSPKCSTCHKDR